VHDELVLECPRDEQSVVLLKDLVQDAMEVGVLERCPPNSFHGIPLAVKMSVGRTLGSLREVA
jgi:DNA polymerase I-like protein with 3'-5' exonuclease and polymerase domains